MSLHTAAINGATVTGGVVPVVTYLIAVKCAVSTDTGQRVRHTGSVLSGRNLNTNGPGSISIRTTVDVVGHAPIVGPDDCTSREIVGVVPLGANRWVRLFNHSDNIQNNTPRSDIECTVVVSVQVIPSGSSEIGDQQKRDIVAVLEGIETCRQIDRPPQSMGALGDEKNSVGWENLRSEIHDGLD